jgi:hypothetical protein
MGTAEDSGLLQKPQQLPFETMENTQLCTQCHTLKVRQTNVVVVVVVPAGLYMHYLLWL